MTAYRIASNIDFQPVDDCLMALDLNHNAYYSLNDTARFFIERITSGHSIEEIARDAVEVYEDVEESRLVADFTDLLNSLLEIGVLESI